MSLLDVLKYRWRVLKNPRAHELETGEELDFHVHLEAMQREHAGDGRISSAEATREARRKLGNATYYREETRRASGLQFFDTIAQDTRFAFRTLRSAPTFTAVAIVTLAIGIGANTAMFSAIDALLLRPLPFREPSRLMAVSLTGTPVGRGGVARDDLVWSYLKFQVFRDAQTVFSDLALWRESMFTVRSTGDALRVHGEFVDSHYFPTLGAQAALGRGFTPDDDRQLGGSHLVILSQELWRAAFNGETSALGKILDVDGDTYTVLGVAPAGFKGLSGESAFWIPIASMRPEWHVADDPWAQNFFAIARLKDGVTPEHATSIVAGIGRRIDIAQPDTRGTATPTRFGATARLLDATRVDVQARRILLILFGAVGLVLLIACANVANLFLVRANARRREIAVRLAIGAVRWRVIRQLLVESVILALLGGVASLGVAWIGTRMIASLHPGSALRSQTVSGVRIVEFVDIHLNVEAFLFAAGVAIATGMAFGIAPALKATRPSLTESLREDGSAQRAALRRFSSRDALTVAQLALAVVLLASSGLLMRSLEHLLQINPGFDSDHVLTFQINRAPAWSRDSISKFYDVALARLAAVPGVAGVAVVDCPPFSTCSRAPIVFHDRPPVAHGAEPVVGVHWITPSWPSVVRVPLIRGRYMMRTDDLDRQKVVLINVAAARAFWPNSDPIGKTVSVGGPDTATVVGIVGDVLYESMIEPAKPDVYVSYYQVPFTYRMMVFVKTKVPPTSIAADVKRALAEVAPGFPAYDFRPLTDQFDLSTSDVRVSALLISLFAMVALGLAIVGTYGVISYSVAQRTREIGVRIALGATTTNITRLVVGHGVVLAAIGGAFGLAGALALTRLLRSLLFGVQTTDPLTLAGIAIVLALAALAASWIPARRAAGIPVVRALRGG